MATLSQIVSRTSIDPPRPALATELGQGSTFGSPYVVGVAVFASLGGLLFGYDQGVISNVIVNQSFGSYFPKVFTDPDTKGWVVSILELGAWLGALLMGYISDRLGRRKSIIVAVFIFLLGSALQTAAPKSQDAYLFAGRFVAGLSIGMLAMVVPAYQSEIAPVHLRGTLTALQQFNITVGILLAFWISYGTHFIGGINCTNIDFNQAEVDCPGFGRLDPAYCAEKIGCVGQHTASWRIPLGVQLLPALILGTGILFFPESPRWLMGKHRDEEAIQVLSRLRRLPKDHRVIQLEYKQIKAAVMLDEESERDRYPHLLDGSRKSEFKRGALKYVDLIRRRPWLHRVFLGSAINFFQQFTGINAIIYYAPTIFASVGLSGESTSILATGVVGIVNTLSTIPAVLWVDKWGRRPILLVGSLAMLAVTLVNMSLNIAYEDSWSSHKAAGWAAVTMVWLFIANFAYSWGPMGWIYPADIMPVSIRSQALSITTSANWMCNFIIGQVTPRMIKNLRWGTYLFFSVWLALSVVFVYFFVPETRGRSIEEIDAIFRDTTAAEDEERRKRIHRELGLEESSDALDTHIKEKSDDDNVLEKNLKQEGQQEFA
ncbi:general substrate transporter [Atractiella rhizophila]|nr:general substrate transporter [Atractiella rhizophila]